MRHGGMEVDTPGRRILLRLRRRRTMRSRQPRRRCELLESGPVRVRIGVHTGAPQLTGEGYVGVDVHLAARIGAPGTAARSCSRATRDGELGAAHELLDLGEHRLKDFDDPVPLFQLGARALPAAEDDLKHESAAPGELVRRPRPRTRRRSSARIRGRSAARSRSPGPGGSGKTRLAHRGRLRARAGVPRRRLLGRARAARRPGARARGDRAACSAPRDELAAPRRRARAAARPRQLRAGRRGGTGGSRISLVEYARTSRLLVTSRERLRLRDEVEYPVEPLPAERCRRTSSPRAPGLRRATRP